MSAWEDSRYNESMLALKTLSIQVYYAMVGQDNPTGYKYRIGTLQGTQLYSSMDECKRAAVKSALGLLARDVIVLQGMDGQKGKVNES